MNRVQTFGPLDQVGSATLNTWQDNTLGIAQVPGLLLTEPVIRAPNDGNVYVAPIAMLALGTNLVYSTTSETAVALSGLTSGQWRYLYAFISGGAIAFELVTTAPHVDMVHKDNAGSPDTSRRYLAAVRATGATSVLPFRKVGREYTYRLSAESGTTPFLALNGGAGSGITTWTTVTIANFSSGFGFLPPHARVALLRARLVRTAAGTGVISADLRTNGDTANALRAAELGNGLNGDDQTWNAVRIETNSSQQIQWAATTNGNLYLECHGFRE